jgi:hypothetical protein
LGLVHEIVKEGLLRLSYDKGIFPVSAEDKTGAVPPFNITWLSTFLHDPRPRRRKPAITILNIFFIQIIFKNFNSQCFG